MIKVSLTVESFSILSPSHYLNFCLIGVHHFHLPEFNAVVKVGLCTSSTFSSACRNHPSDFFLNRRRVIRILSREPVIDILQRSGEGKVVFRNAKQDCIRFVGLIPNPLDRLRHTLNFNIFIEERNLTDVGPLKIKVGMFLVDNSPEEPWVDRVFPQGATNEQYLMCRSFHVI